MHAADAVRDPARGRRSPGSAVARVPRPMVRLVGVRLLQGVLTLALVSVLVFFATQVLPGNAAHAALGQSVTPERLKALEAQLGLDRPLLAQYWDFISGLLTGHPGTSLATKEPLGQVVGPALVNSAVLVLLAGVFSTVIGVGLFSNTLTF